MKPQIHELYFQGFNNLFYRDHRIQIWNSIKSLALTSKFEHMYRHSSEFMSFLYAKDHNDYNTAFNLAKDSTADYVYCINKFLFKKMNDSINNTTGGSIKFDYETFSKMTPRIPMDDPRSDNQIIIDVIKDFDYPQIYHAITEYSDKKESFLFLLDILFIEDKFCGEAYQKFNGLLKDEIKEACTTKLKYYQFYEDKTIIQNFNSVLNCIIGAVIMKNRQDLFDKYGLITSQINYLFSETFHCHADEVFFKVK